MKLTDDSQLYLSTNQGCFYSLRPAVDRCSPSSSSSTTGGSSSQPAWRLLYSSPRKAAITCMQILHTDRQLLPHSASPSARAGTQKGNTRWAVFGDGVGVVTCLQVEDSVVPQSRVAIPSGHTRGSGFVLHQALRHPPPLAQGGALQPAQTSCSQDSRLSAQVSETQKSGRGRQEPFRRDDSGQCASQQPEQQTCPNITSSLPSFSWAAYQGNPVLGIFHPSHFGCRHVFSTSIAGTPMRWWLLPEHTSSSAATDGATEFQNLTRSEHAASPAVAAGQIRATPGDPNSLLRRASSSAIGQQLSTGHMAPQLLAEVTPIPGRGSQIVAMDACWSRRLLVCGDMAGHVMAFTVPPVLLQEGPASGECGCECGCERGCECKCESECERFC